MLQYIILAFVALLLIGALVILVKQALKQRKLMKKPKIESDVRDQSNWAKDYKKSYFKTK